MYVHTSVIKKSVTIAILFYQLTQSNSSISYLQDIRLGYFSTEMLLTAANQVLQIVFFRISTYVTCFLCRQDFLATEVGLCKILNFFANRDGFLSMMDVS
jgi:dynactin complex subunit